MKTNYHTHTYRCKHAMGNDERIVLNAFLIIPRGLTSLPITIPMSAWSRNTCRNTAAA